MPSRTMPLPMPPEKLRAFDMYENIFSNSPIYWAKLHDQMPYRQGLHSDQTPYIKKRCWRLLINTTQLYFNNNILTIHGIPQVHIG